MNVGDWVFWLGLVSNLVLLAVNFMQLRRVRRLHAETADLSCRARAVLAEALVNLDKSRQMTLR